MCHSKLYMFLFFLLNFLTLRGQNDKVLCIDNVNVITMTKDTILENHRVWIKDGKITSIDKALLPIEDKSITVIDGSEKFLIPGLAEMHYHFRSEDIESDFKLFLANGITTVRNMAQFSGQDHIEIRNKTLTGELFFPNYFTAGPYLTKTDLPTVQDVNKVVEYHSKMGYDFLKIADNLPDTIYLKLLDETQKNKLPVIGHAQRHLPLEFSLRMRSIEHIEEFIYLNDIEGGVPLFEKSDPQLKAIAEQIQQSGIYLGTTLSIFEFINNCLNDPKFRAYNTDPLAKYLAKAQRYDFLTERNDYRKLRGKVFNGIKAQDLFNDYFIWIRKFVKILSDNGVPLIVGSDTYGMVIVGFSLHREMELLQNAGLGPYEILLGSTVTPARYLNTISNEGTISVGKNANMVLLEKNPLEDIKNTKTINGVFVMGKWLNKQHLEEMLDDVEKAFK